MPSAPLQRLRKALEKAGDIEVIAERAGVDKRLARRALKAIPVNAGAYLHLCAACGIDPVDGRPAIIDHLPLPDLDWNRVAIKILLRLIGNSSLRKLGAAWKVDYAAINRAKNEQPVNVENFLKICKGLDVHPHQFLKRVPPAPPMFHGEQSLQQIAEGISA